MSCRFFVIRGLRKALVRKGNVGAQSCRLTSRIMAENVNSGWGQCVLLWRVFFHTRGVCSSTASRADGGGTMRGLLEGGVVALPELSKANVYFV